MSGSGNCHMCDRQANNLFEGTLRWFFDKEFCSHGCKNSYRGTRYGYFGAGVSILGLILLVSTNNPAMLSIFIFGLGVIVFGSYLKSESKERKVGSSRMMGSARSFGSIHRDPQDQLIYSNILKTKVHPCCYQSARLNDQYCACGRVIEYPVKN